jgi:hypothetical protein
VSAASLVSAFEHQHPQGPEGRSHWCLTCEVHYLWGLGSWRCPDKPSDGGPPPVCGLARIALLEGYVQALAHRRGFTPLEKERLRDVAMAEIAQERAEAERRTAGLIGARKYAPSRVRPAAP